jgi:hypothetical protein
MEELSDTLQTSEIFERSLSNDDDPNMCAVSDASTTSSGDSLSDDELQQASHPLTSSSTSSNGQHRALNASGKTFRRLHERSDSGQIRSKLLMKLGIELGGGIMNGTSTSTEASRVVQKGQEDAYNIALKRDHGQIDRKIQHSKKPIESLSTMPGDDRIIEKSMKRERRAICFDASVKVHPIPARSDYSNRMRSVMWVSSTEIQQNAARNSLEFAAEEWDVSKVVNDEDMILYGGELIHPIHFIQHNEMVSSNGASGK